MSTELTTEIHSQWIGIQSRMTTTT